MATPTEIKWALKRPRVFPGYIYWFNGMLNAFAGFGGAYMYAWGVLVPYIRRDYKITATEIAFTLSIQRVYAGLQAPVAGYLLDTVGPKWVACVGLTVGAIGHFMIAWWPVPAAWWLWLTRGVVLVVMGQAALYFCSDKVMTWYFIKNRGRMMALLTIGSAFGGMVFVPFTEFMAGTAWGWRGGAFVNGLVLLVVVVLNLFFNTNKPPQHYGLLPDNEKLPHERTKEELEAAKSKGAAKVMTADDFLPSMSIRDAFKTRAFWTFAIAGAFAGFTGFGLQTWFVAHLRAEGYTSGQAAFFYMMFFPSTILGRIIASIWADKISPKWFIAYANYGQAFPSVALALLARNPLVVWLWIAWYASSFGMSPALGGHLRASWFGRKWYATIRGIILFVDLGFGFGGPLFVGWLADYFNNYRMSWLVMSAVWFCIGSVYAFVGRPPKQMREAQLKAKEAGIRIVL